MLTVGVWLTAKLCPYFCEGSCSRGSKCTYIHDISPNSSLSFATRSPPSSFGADSSETAVPLSRSIGSPRSELDYHDDDGDDHVIYQETGDGQCPACKIELKWVPGHHKIRGNEKANTLAKSGSVLPSIYPYSASNAYVSNLNNQRLLKDWQLRWVNDPSQNRPTEYSMCNVNPPLLHLSKPFKSLL
ncbi:hypothetical protein BS47DRAFT_1397864 [Hydnum rufescens UP504]|uniref:C3H1-type domain-containing protein n=1 Tax=Hydnum rufescens UP504 TaxID=1448309 RepID=A0A9P6DRE9_9AGAM|nr:hypothetical protein BS47DRAFT_1397864 [Hydnum rufescens UP504]